ncbi:hypothetical protein BVRB_8g186380 [Beta vulgaris subsp. vulgaris]|uniref:Uncharacterized protein n=1 Tax=Beta vulgaris subsp. vulgaris TaxID=3555 RepID=A0A0J8BSB9_BETVV|nr:hypothetical protein BVRB_8g186380 [Beta vulgaris subsp. vulgaris]
MTGPPSASFMVVFSRSSKVVMPAEVAAPPQTAASSHSVLASSSLSIPATVGLFYLNF